MPIFPTPNKTRKIVFSLASKIYSDKDVPFAYITISLPFSGYMPGLHAERQGRLIY